MQSILRPLSSALQAGGTPLEERPVHVASARAPAARVPFWVCADETPGRQHTYVEFSREAIEAFPFLGNPVKGLTVVGDGGPGANNNGKPVTVDEDVPRKDVERISLWMDAEGARCVQETEAHYRKWAKDGDIAYHSLQKGWKGTHCTMYAAALVRAATGTQVPCETRIETVKGEKVFVSGYRPALKELSQLQNELQVVRVAPGNSRL